MKITFKTPIALAEAKSNPVPLDYCGVEVIDIDVHLCGSVINPAVRGSLRPGDRLLLRTVVIGVERAP